MSFDAWGKRREVNWQPMGEEAIATFNTDTTTRGFTGHEQIDAVGLIHMNGRVYDAELGRFLSADPHIQALDNLQNFNRYSYVLNNPLSYTDPSGYFFKKLFKAIGKAFGKIFKAIGRAFKKLLRSPIFRAIIQIVACSNPATCVIASGAITAAMGGSIGDVFKAMAMSFVQIATWGVVKGFLSPIAKSLGAVGSAASVAGKASFALVKGLVHGVVGGALAVAQGGNFIAGFAANAIGAFAGAITQGMSPVASTAIVAAAGCAGAALSGGKCANGAVTAAFAHLYNQLGKWKTQVETTRKRVVAWIGGADDARYRIVARMFGKYGDPDSGDRYFSHLDGEGLENWAKENAGNYLTIIGHSNGAHRAMIFVAEGNYIDRLITVDPVSFIGERPNLTSVQKYSGSWSNYNSTSISLDNSDLAAIAGGRYGNVLSKYSNHTNSNLNHRDICYAYCKP